MAQITVNLIHDLRMKHKVKEQIPFIYGLRTGFLRAWLFTGLKVLFIFSLLNGTDMVSRLEANISLLDQYVRDDYTVLQVGPTIMPHLPKKTTEKVPVVVGLNEPRGLELAEGSVASAHDISPPNPQP